MDSTFQIMSLAAALGALHALDADHLAVVTSLSSTRPGWRHAIGFTLRWALGHALSLITLATLMLVTARNFSHHLSGATEQLASLSLIAIALWLLARQLHPCGGGDIMRNSRQQREHKRHPLLATATGILHGLAGSAPILALIPLTKLQGPVQILYFVLLFSTGVMLSMFLVGFILGHLWHRAHHASQKMARLLQMTAACATLAIGTQLLLKG